MSFINAISQFADSSTEAKNTVVTWIDDVVKEGIKEIQVMSIPLREGVEGLFDNPQVVQEYLNRHMSTKIHHLTGNEYNNVASYG